MYVIYFNAKLYNIINLSKLQQEIITQLPLPALTNNGGIKFGKKAFTPFLNVFEVKIHLYLVIFEFYEC